VEDVEEENPWTIGSEPWGLILRHTLEMYPKEACGILLCHSENPKHIKEVYPTKNVSLEDQTSRYLVDPLEFLEVDKWADERGLDICGFYHSHPDHPSGPSEYDRKMAWEGYLYIILSIKGGRFHDARAWIYDSDNACFNEALFKLHPFPLSSHPAQESAGVAMPSKNNRQ
jgi:proteasome lid subunit RPN8/RPN11